MTSPLDDFFVKVAPHTGAWIETDVLQAKLDEMQSHPTRVRGLKPPSENTDNKELGRTPHGCVD